MAVVVGGNTNIGTNSITLYAGSPRRKTPLGQKNWNKTPLKYCRSIDGPIAIEALSEGRLFYTDKVYKVIHEVSWIDADKSVDCPQALYENYNSYKTDGEEATALKGKQDTVTASKANGVSVFPNPSDNSFTFIPTLEQMEMVQIKVCDTKSNLLYSVKQSLHPQSGIKWDASEFGSGIYYYKMTIDDIETHSGKLVKF